VLLAGFETASVGHALVSVAVVAVEVFWKLVEETPAVYVSLGGQFTRYLAVV
jgi:hypothetical protein